jgi:hypothetical protein
MLRRALFALALLLPTAAWAGGPEYPPGPLAKPACSGGNSVLGYTSYGTPLVCGTALASGSIANGVSQLGVYIGANTIGPLTPSGDVSFSSPSFTVNSARGGNITIPNVTDTVALLAAAQTLTNKTVSCASNTCTVRANLDLTGTLATANFPALTGAVTTSAGSLVTSITNGAVGASALASGAIATSLGYVPGNTTAVGGTINALPKFTGAQGITIANSSITDAGNGITIGSPTGGGLGPNTLNVGGAIAINGVAVGTGGGSGTPGGTSGQIQSNNAGAFGGFTASGSCTINATTGVVSCPLAGVPLQNYALQGNTLVLVTQGLGNITPGDYAAYDASSNIHDGGFVPLKPANNLSDLTSAASARGNLSLGTVATQNSNAIALTGGSLTGVSVTGLATPVATTDAANKSYVDGAVNGALSHTGVAVATAAILPNTPTYNNGASGVGATLTGTTSTTLTIDGQAVTNGQRVLVKNEATAANNGIYVATIGGSPWVLTRATDFNSVGPSNLALGAYVVVATGTVNCSPECSIWGLGSPTPASITIGTTALTFNMIGASGGISSVSLTAGTGNLVVGGSPGAALTIATKVALDTQSGNSIFALPSTDAGGVVYRTNVTTPQLDTIAAPTGGFASGFGISYYSVLAGNSINPQGGALIGGLSALTLGANQEISLFSDSTGYRPLIGMPTPTSQDGTTLLSNDFSYKQVGTAQLASAAVTTAKLGSSLTLTTPSITLGSDATGDLFYRNSGGAVTRLGIGTTGQVLAVTSGLPAWATSSASLSTTDGTHTVSSTSSQTYGDCFVIGGSAGAATVNLTQQVNSSNTGAPYTIATTDACGTVEVGAFTYTYPLGTLGAGFGVRLHFVGTTGTATINATGGNFTGLGIANASSFTMVPGQYADITSVAGPLGLVQLSGAGGGGAPLTTTDSIHSVSSTTQLTFGPSLVVGGSAGQATVNPTVTIDPQGGNSTFVIPNTEGGKTLLRTNTSAETDTLAAATATGFGSGYSFDYITSGAGNTIAPTTSSIGGLTSFTFGNNQFGTIASDGAQYRLGLGVPVPPAQNGATVLLDTMKWGTQTTALGTGTSVSLSAPKQYYVCTGTCTVTPPVPAPGYEFCVLNDDNVATVITLAALGSSAMYEKTNRGGSPNGYGTAGTGTFVSGGAVGDKVCIVGRDSTHYLTLSFNGTWTAN